MEHIFEKNWAETRKVSSDHRDSFFFLAQV